MGSGFMLRTHLCGTIETPRLEPSPCWKLPQIFKFHIILYRDVMLLQPGLDHLADNGISVKANKRVMRQRKIGSYLWFVAGLKFLAVRWRCHEIQSRVAEWQGG